MTALHDVTSSRNEQSANRESLAPPPAGDAMETRLREHRKRLTTLMRSPALGTGDIASALSEVTRLASDLLSVERVGVWQLSADGSTLECLDLFTRGTGEHTRGQRLHASDLPSYFEALAEDRALAASAARRDPRMRELESTYLAPHGIEAKLDAPVYLRGRMVGLVSHEHTGETRRFQFWEELVAATMADFVALVIQAREQLRVEQQLGELHKRVDQMLEDRTNAVVRENADLQREVDALQLAAEAIRRSEDDLRRLFAASPVPMLLVARKSQQILMVNEKCASALRCKVDDLRDKPVKQLFVHETDLTELWAEVSRVNSEESRELHLRSLDGQSFWAQVSARTVMFSSVDTVMVGFVDLTPQKAVEHQLRFLAQRDPLTQAYNRHHFWQLAHSEMARVRRYARPLSIAMIDADLFKGINDQYGHDVGDQVLRMIVDTCHEGLRKNDVLARYGGEELIVLLPETLGEGARVVMERLRERVANTPLMLDDGRSVSITVSIGIAAVNDPNEGVEPLLKRADDALYRAKHNGRNRVEMG
jgi:diguanylate cyclase (GGDEF)-like protein/PAS domain S-box-containing protein